MSPLVRRLVFGGAWVTFVAYAALAAPPSSPELTKALVRGSLTGDFGAVDASIAAVFCLLGVVPLLTVTVLSRDGARRRVPAWPFAIASFAIGAFAFLPYLAARSDPIPATAPPGRARRLLQSPVLAALILVALVALPAWGLSAGHAAAYLHAYRTTAIVHVMSIDLLVCTAIVHYLVEEARRSHPEQKESALARGVRWIPLLGPALWSLLVRPARASAR